MRYALILTLLLAPGLANAACARPEKPHFPDPKTVSADAVQKLDQDMQRYYGATNAYVACLSKEANETQSDAAKTIAYYNNDFLAVYNKRTQ